ncbi:MAG: HNH endonuclease [Bacteroidota bacterium]
MAEPSKKARKAFIEKRASGCCEYCLSQSRFSPDPFTIEHIFPRSKGGNDDYSNLALACQGCNNRKYNFTEAMDPVTGTMVPLFHPRQDPWANHFRWNDDCSRILGISPEGRATIDKLGLNRPGLVNLRKVLYLAGEHPPA